MLVLQYAMVGKVEKYHTLTLKLPATKSLFNFTVQTDDPDDIYVNYDDYLREYQIELKLNRSGSEQLTDITLSQTLKVNKRIFDSHSLTDKYQNDQLEEKIVKHIESINELKILINYESKKKDDSSQEMINKMNKQISEHQDQIDTLSNRVTFNSIKCLNCITLPQKTVGRMDLHKPTRGGIPSMIDSVDFYWYIVHNILLDQALVPPLQLGNPVIFGSSAVKGVLNIKKDYECDIKKNDKKRRYDEFH